MTRNIKEKQIKQYDLSKPAELQKMADTLKDFIIKNNLYVTISSNAGKKNYVLVEGWQFAGGLLGIVAQVVDTEDISIETNQARIPRWKATVELKHVKTGEIIGRGVAIAAAREKNMKRQRDDFETLSMAQTRAVGKAYRLAIGWIIKLAGYEPTPAEEVVEDNEEEKEQKKEQVDLKEISKKITEKVKSKK